MDFLAIIAVALAIWRLIKMIQDESGPGDIFSKLRAKVASLTPKRYSGSFQEGFFCLWCMSIWWSAVASLFLSQGLVEYIITTLCLSALVVIFDTLFKKIDS